MRSRDDFFWLSLLTLVYLLFWVPVIDVHPPLSTGDNGKDLYAFWLTSQGKWPYRDYWWPYGPLMPFYYAFWFLVGGVNLVSIRIGLAIIYFLCSLLVYRTLRLLTSGAIAFLSSLAFLSFRMGWTYNHIGVLPFLLLSILCLWKFFLTAKIQWGYFGVLALAGMALVKISGGITSFAVFLASLLLYQGYLKLSHPGKALGWKHFILLPSLFGVVVFGTYGFLFRGLSRNWIAQCLLLASLGPRRSVPPPWMHLKHLVLWFTVWDRSRLFWLAAVLLFGGVGLWCLGRRKTEGVDRRVFGFIVGSLLLFIPANPSDYFFQEGLIYRFDFWVFPILVLFLGLSAEWISVLFSRKMKLGLGIFLFFTLLWQPWKNLREASAWHTPERYLGFPQGRIYAGGPLSDVEVLRETRRFIVEHTTPDQEIFAAPYEPLYCFLSGRRQAVREIHILEGIPISDEQEEAMIRQLEIKQIRYVVLSNRYRSKEISVGDFGITYAKKLARYISENYRVVQTFGPWEEGGQAVKVFERGARGEKLNLLS